MENNIWYTYSSLKTYFINKRTFKNLKKSWITENVRFLQKLRQGPNRLQKHLKKRF